MEDLAAPATSGVRQPKGTLPQIVEQLQERIRKGITFFTVIFGDLNSAQSIDLFAGEVMPAFA